MKYCKNCILPDTRPGIFLNDDGICSGCIGHWEKDNVIDWKARKKSLDGIVERVRLRNSNYDCLIPVSGGKDSHYQVYVMKNLYGLKPLCYSYKTPARTELGEKNLRNLIDVFGVDHFDFRVNPHVERKFMLKALKKNGIAGLPFHMAMFSTGLRLAVDMRIPLIVWGENSQLEFGGSAEDRNNPYLDNEWLKKHGCVHSTVEDWTDENLSLKEMAPYTLPSDEQFRKVKVESIFLGYYLKWESHENYKIAERFGFQKSPDGPVIGTYDFADLDDKFITIHHYIKWLKFGICRAFDTISLDIRYGRMSRDEGIKLIKNIHHEEINPDHLDAFCRFLGITEDEFWKTIEQFRNTDIWKKDKNGEWDIPGYLEFE